MIEAPCYAAPLFCVPTIHFTRLLDFIPVPNLRVSFLSLLLSLALCVPSFGGQALSREAEWLQQYLRIDTSNPPGNEHEAAAFLRTLLHNAGISTKLLVSPTGRPSLYARLKADPPGKGSLVLTHHLDVVPAGPGWSQEPFGGVESSGKIWGRGAVDDKSLGIAHLDSSHLGNTTQC